MHDTRSHVTGLLEPRRWEYGPQRSGPGSEPWGTPAVRRWDDGLGSGTTTTEALMHTVGLVCWICCTVLPPGFDSAEPNPFTSGCALIG